MTTRPTVHKWGIVVAVKDLCQAKSRMRTLRAPVRARLVLAMLTDVLAALRATPHVTHIVVVTDDGDVARVARRGGARVVPDPGRGLNAAFVAGARAVPVVSVAAVMADLPLLTAEDLSATLRAAEHHATAYVPDRAGSGTTILTARGVPLEPAFGPGSAMAHARTAVRLDATPGLRHDIDTLDDLAAASREGLGPATASVARSLVGRAEQATG